MSTDSLLNERVLAALLGALQKLCAERSVLRLRLSAGPRARHCFTGNVPPIPSKEALRRRPHEGRSIRGPQGKVITARRGRLQVVQHQKGIHGIAQREGNPPRQHHFVQRLALDGVERPTDHVGPPLMIRDILAVVGPGQGGPLLWSR
jgi:hypothetical protein